MNDHPEIYITYITRLGTTDETREWTMEYVSVGEPPEGLGRYRLVPVVSDDSE